MFRNSKGAALLVLLLALFSGLFGCTVSNVDGDEVAILVRQPWFFGHGGVDPVPQMPGSFISAMSTKVVRMKSTPRLKDLAFDDLFTRSKEPVDISAYMVIQIDATRAPHLYSTAGVDWYDNQVKLEFAESVRDEAKHFSMPAIVADAESLATIEQRVTARLSRYIKESNLPVMLIKVGINKASPNADVLEEINRTSQQNQRNKTEVERATAETSRKRAEEEKAKADRAYRETFGMSTAEYLKLRELELEKEKLAIVRGKDNVHIILNSGAVPTFSVGK